MSTLENIFVSTQGTSGHFPTDIAHEKLLLHVHGNSGLALLCALCMPFAHVKAASVRLANAEVSASNSRQVRPA